MSWPELHSTLADLVRAIQPDPASGLRVDEAVLAVPLELTTATVGDELVVLGRVPHSRWAAGFLPRTSMSRMRLERVPAEGADDGR